MYARTLCAVGQLGKTAAGWVVDIFTTLFFLLQNIVGVLHRLHSESSQWTGEPKHGREQNWSLLDTGIEIIDFTGHRY